MVKFVMLLLDKNKIKISKKIKLSAENLVIKPIQDEILVIINICIDTFKKKFIFKRS